MSAQRNSNNILLHTIADSKTKILNIAFEVLFYAEGKLYTNNFQYRRVGALQRTAYTKEPDKLVVETRRNEENTYK